MWATSLEKSELGSVTNIFRSCPEFEVGLRNCLLGISVASQSQYLGEQIDL
jgi:hypothetical protein